MKKDKGSVTVKMGFEIRGKKQRVTWKAPANEMVVVRNVDYLLSVQIAVCKTAFK